MHICGFLVVCVMCTLMIIFRTNLMLGLPNVYFWDIPTGKGFVFFILRVSEFLCLGMLFFVRMFTLVLHLAHLFLNPIVHPICPMTLCLIHIFSILMWSLLYPHPPLPLPAHHCLGPITHLHNFTKRYSIQHFLSFSHASDPLTSTKPPTSSPSSGFSSSKAHPIAPITVASKAAIPCANLPSFGPSLSSRQQREHRPPMHLHDYVCHAITSDTSDPSLIHDTSLGTPHPLSHYVAY